MTVICIVFILPRVKRGKLLFSVRRALIANFFLFAFVSIVEIAIRFKQVAFSDLLR